MEPIVEPIVEPSVQKLIPKTIFICHKNIKCLSMTYNFWKRLNPNYRIHLFNDVMCEQFLLHNFSELHYNIFKFIPDGPIKSDFWRLCILYTYGGIYVDADIHPLVSLNKYLLHSSNFVTCITSSNGNFNPHFIAAKKNDPILKQCIEEYIQIYTHNKHAYAYWDWSVVNIFNKVLSNVKKYVDKTHLHAFVLDNKRYQIFIETINAPNAPNAPNGSAISMNSLKPRGLHDYYCTFQNKRIFNTRYINYDPDEHKFKNYVVKNRNKNHNIIGFHLNVNLSKLKNMKKI